MDVFFYEVFQEERDAMARHLPPEIDAGFSQDTIQESGHADPPAGFISIRTQSVIPGRWAPWLRGILTRSTGFDHVRRFQEICAMPVRAGYLPHYCSRAVAEQSLLLWLSLMRRLGSQVDQFRTFSRDGITGLECEGKTLVVAGVGNIGFQVCRIGSSLGMETIGVDVVMRHPSIRYASIQEALPAADVIVCAMNLTEQNRGYFDYHTLKKTKQGTIFVNVARGELSPAADLLRLLEEGHLGGVGLDVYEDESEIAVKLRSGAPDPAAHIKAVLDLAGHKHAVLTPHNAFNTFEALERKAAQSAEQVVHFLKSGSFLWPVP
jgi:D-lactate dehydrogenase